MGSDVEDGEISEEEKRISAIEGRHQRDHKSLSRSKAENYSSDDDQGSGESRDEEEREERRMKVEKPMKGKDRVSERGKYEARHQKDKNRSRNSRRKSPNDENENSNNRRSEANNQKNGYHRNIKEDDEALPGDVPFKTDKTDDKQEPDETTSSSKEISLSVEETNKLRAKLGLAPLKITGNESASSKEKKKKELDSKTDKDYSHLEIIPGSEVRHNPAENLTQKLGANKLRDKLKRKREKRKQESKLLAVKSLADSSDEDASSWVMSQKQKQEEKERAKRRAQMFEDLDDDFGIGNLVEADKKETIKKEKNYDSKALAGLKVEHSFDRFEEGKNMILTLKDSAILDEEAMDTLENVNVVDQEKAEKNIIDIKKAKQAYNKFDVEDVDDVTGEMETKNILYKYDEEIDGIKKKSFVIGQGGSYNQDEADRRRREEIRRKLNKSREAVSLNTGVIKLASDYMTQEEVSATKFKKVKKKKKIKAKMLKADDLINQLEKNEAPNDSTHFDSYQDLEMETMPPPPISEKGK